ncbi:MAG TPA: branched-chain amino acid ABC transporter permease [Clostridiaceae bacterium]|nr:branched-chain amino acid ABC transporter permease [Clostridiaceae bacterium]
MFSPGEIILQQTVNGLILGCFYALISLGYTMVYGIVRLLNFAHGDIYMVGAFVGFFVFGALAAITGTGWLSIILAMVAAMFLCGVLGFLIQRFAYRPLLDAPRLSLLITAIGVSLILQNAMMILTNGEFKFFNHSVNPRAGISLGNVTITWIQMVLLGITAVLLISLTWFVSKTIWGKAMRAISMDRPTCRLMGINVNTIIGITFFIGSALAAVAGVMACVYYGNVHYFMGYIMGMKAFTAAVIGGIGSIPGAMLGGLLLGLLEAGGTQVLGSSWKDVFAFGILIIMLIFKPTGLLGKTEVERM